jgi:hypothetical protein
MVQVQAPAFECCSSQIACRAALTARDSPPSPPLPTAPRRTQAAPGVSRSRPPLNSRTCWKIQATAGAESRSANPCRLARVAPVARLQMNNTYSNELHRRDAGPRRARRVLLHRPAALRYCNFFHFHHDWLAKEASDTMYPIQKVTKIFKKVTKPYNFVTELEISSSNVLSLLPSEVAYIETGHILP